MALICISLMISDIEHFSYVYRPSVCPLVLWGKDPRMGLRPHTPRVRGFAAEVSLAFQLWPVGVRARLFRVSTLCTSLYVASSVNPWL